MKDAEFDQCVKKVIRSNFHMISSSADHQQSEETYNANKFELPNPAGKAGGACTSAFLQGLYDNGADAKWIDTLRGMRTVLKGMGYNQIPQLTSSRLVDVEKKMQIVPPGSGRRRALLIGINYVGQQGALTACHNDVYNLLELLVTVYGFKETEILVLMDDGKHHPPTKMNIEDAMLRMTRYSQPNDVVFVSFSGHGGQTEDLDGDEDDGFDETLIPVDFRTEGHIVDDDILRLLVKPMASGVHVTVIMDCCHSGTVLDLPYTYSADNPVVKRERGFNMEIVNGGPKAGSKDDAPKSPQNTKANNEKSEKSKKEERRKKEAEKKKKENTKKKNNKKKREEEEEDTIEVGPKVDASGVPSLPIRKAPSNPPPPPKKCTIM